jgi:hypothetical protein
MNLYERKEIMNYTNTVYELYDLFMPSKTKPPGKKNHWKKVAQRNAFIIVGMALGMQMTVEQIKAIKENLV